MQQNDHSISRTALDPAADAAAMLLRLGFAIFAIVLPSAILMSRWVIVVLVPIGAVLIILAAILRGDPFRILRALGGTLWSIPGLTAVSLLAWSIFSLGWTPEPGEAAEKIFKTGGVVLLGLLAIQSLPGRMRASNLHLIAIGVAIGALLILVSVGASLFGRSVLEFPAATPGRAAVMLSCLGWPAAAWLLIKDRRALAALLIALVLAVAAFGPTDNALIPMLVALAVLAGSWLNPERAAAVLAAVVAAAILAAPALAMLSQVLAGAAGLPAGGLVARFGEWWTLASADPIHLMTGRGYNAIHAAREFGLIGPSMPASLLGDIWFDLGLLGAAALAILAHAGVRAAGRLGLEVAPLALAGFASAFTYAAIAPGATQTWWFNGMIVFAIVLVSVERGRYRTVRPRAAVKPGHLRMRNPQPTA
jgi:hypothetical protein